MALKNQSRITIKGTLQLLCQELPCKQSSCRVPSEYPQRYSNLQQPQPYPCSRSGGIWMCSKSKYNGQTKVRNQAKEGIKWVIVSPTSQALDQALKKVVFKFSIRNTRQTILLFFFYRVGLRLNVIVKVNQSHILHTGKCNYVNESGSEVKFKSIRDQIASLNNFPPVSGFSDCWFRQRIPKWRY